MTNLDVGASLLEIEALVMLTRAAFLHRDQEGFLSELFKVRSKLNAFTKALTGPGELTALFLAVSEEPQAADAVDPQATSTGTPSTRETNS